MFEALLSNRTVGVLVEALPRILTAGLTMTIPLTLLSFFFAMLIGMIKDTSLASNITVAELFMAGQRVAARTYIFLPIYCEVAVVYLLFCTVITKLQALLERQLNARGFQ